MKLLHTSDWHLGLTLNGMKRFQEIDSFLDWLYNTIVAEQVDALLVAGDIFDTSAPNNRSQEQYYRFLCRVASSSCRHVVITGGNHDSPTFLNAPRELLKVLKVHVVGSATENPADEVLVLDDTDGKPACIVCAVPFLHDRYVRGAEAGEGADDKLRKLTEGIRSHYAAVFGRALEIRAAAGEKLPLVAMGHLFAAGGEVADGDGVRELYVGSMAQVSGAIFPNEVDYVALGHLHAPQVVGGSSLRRYSGAPLQIGFSESNRTKSVCMVSFHGDSPEVKTIDVPRFQRLERISGNMETIENRIQELAAENESVWLEIIYNGEELIGDLRTRCEEAVEGTSLIVINIKNNRLAGALLAADEAAETLDDLKVDEVFRRCLVVNQVPEEQHGDLTEVFREIILSVEQEDTFAGDGE